MRVISISRAFCGNNSFLQACLANHEHTESQTFGRHGPDWDKWNSSSKKLKFLPSMVGWWWATTSMVGWWWASGLVAFYPTTFNVPPSVLGCTTFYSSVRWATYFECFNLLISSRFLHLQCNALVFHFEVYELL